MLELRFTHGVLLAVGELVQNLIVSVAKKKIINCLASSVVVQIVLDLSMRYDDI